MPNTSWNLLDAMLQRRSWGVQTPPRRWKSSAGATTARRAVPAGGGGGRAKRVSCSTRCLLREPHRPARRQRPGQGHGAAERRTHHVQDRGGGRCATGLFGTGSTSASVPRKTCRSSAACRRWCARATSSVPRSPWRNTTKAAMKVEVGTACHACWNSSPRPWTSPRRGAREVAWDRRPPRSWRRPAPRPIPGKSRRATPLSGRYRCVKARQGIARCAASTVQQATLVQVDGSHRRCVQALQTPCPAGRAEDAAATQAGREWGLPGARLVGGYPFSCLEQQTSKAVGLRDGKLWQTVVANLPTYLDSDGLASYFRRAWRCQHGSATPHGLPGRSRTRLPPSTPLLRCPTRPVRRWSALIAFVDGRIQRNHWSPRGDLDMRACQLLHRGCCRGYGKAQAQGQWSASPLRFNQAHAPVIDWVNVLKRVADVPERDKRRPRPCKYCARACRSRAPSSSSAPSRTTTGGG